MKIGVSVLFGLMMLEVKYGMFSFSCGEVYDEDWMVDDVYDGFVVFLW